MSKHTRGPWSIGRFQSGGRVPIESEHIQVCAVDTDHEHMASDTERADARLIAAAPELLEACHVAAALIRGSGYTESTKALIQLRAAIAKAEQ